MPKTSKINIFNIMDEDELNEELKNSEYSRREYQRLVAMKLISIGLPHKVIAEILMISYETVYRWAKACSEKGIKGLMPNFNGGRPSRLTIKQKLEFGNMLYLSDDILSMTEARQLLIDEFDEKYTLSQVSNIIADLGFEYSAPRPKFMEAPENKEEILLERIEEANITDEDIIVAWDESTMKPNNKTNKGIRLKSDKKNAKK